MQQQQQQQQQQQLQQQLQPISGQPTRLKVGISWVVEFVLD